jgi:uncharacterized protein YjcR
MSSDHKRNTDPMLASPRCGARTRSGKPCRAPAVAGKRRCRMHGGALGSGAPAGNKNALRHGRYSKGTIEWEKKMRDLIQESMALIEKIG